jgi:hypothetical protein
MIPKFSAISPKTLEVFRSRNSRLFVDPHWTSGATEHFWTPFSQDYAHWNLSGDHVVDCHDSLGTRHDSRGVTAQAISRNHEKTSL